MRRGKKVIAMVLSMVMALAIVPATVFAFNPADWNADSGYGSITENGDGTYTLMGDDVLNSDNSHSGPYTMANAANIADGEIVESVDVQIDPAGMEAVVEKFALTVSINGTDGGYKTELLALFQKNNNNAVQVSVGMAPDFTHELTETGIYTLKYRYFDNAGNLYGQFSIEQNGTQIATTSEIDMGVLTSECTTRGYIWFSDISVDGGLVVGTPTPVTADYTKVDEAIAKANGLNRDDYVDFTAVDTAIAAVVRDLDSSRQAEVDAMAQAIEDAIAGLELKQTTEENPAGETGNTVSYQITAGANGTWNKGNTEGLTVTSNGDFSKFTGIRVDGVDVGAENYTAVSGSTVVTLNTAYLETLTEGTHTLTMVYTDGEVSTNFTIAAQTAGVANNMASPQTGDNSNTVMWIAVAVLAAGAMTGTVFFARKKKAE